MSPWIPIIIAVAIGFVNVYQTALTRQSVQLQLTAMTKSKKKLGPSAVPTWKLYWPTGVMVILAASSWIPYFMASAAPQIVPVINGWGALNPGMRVEDIKFLQMTVDGASVKEYASHYKVAAVAFRYNGIGDVFDVSGLQKSGLFDIRDEPIVVLIPLGSTFLATIGKQLTTNYKLLVVPIGVSMDQFVTLRQAVSLGVRIIASTSGPP